jgi:hypothetical protein
MAQVRGKAQGGVASAGSESGARQVVHQGDQQHATNLLMPSNFLRDGSDIMKARFCPSEFLERGFW